LCIKRLNTTSCALMTSNRCSVVGLSTSFPPRRHIRCRNPVLAKCGGEAQHLEKLEVWSPPGLLNVQSSIARPKTPRMEAFLVSLKRS
jgi:hypothetical protein